MPQVPYSHFFRSIEEYQTYSRCLDQIRLGDKVQALFRVLDYWSGEWKETLSEVGMVIDVFPLGYKNPRRICVGFAQKPPTFIGESEITSFQMGYRNWRYQKALELQDQSKWYLWTDIDHYKIVRIYKGNPHV